MHVWKKEEVDWFHARQLWLDKEGHGHAKWIPTTLLLRPTGRLAFYICIHADSQLSSRFPLRRKDSMRTLYEMCILFQCLFLSFKAVLRSHEAKRFTRTEKGVFLVSLPVEY
jgi:hypothetical protein